MRKMTLVLLLLLALLLSCQQNALQETMTADKLGVMIHKYGEDVRQQGTVWEFQLDGVNLACVSDPSNDRMRILAAIIPAGKLQPAQMQHMLEANFHSALDGRYCVANGIVYAAFIHPLSPLNEGQVKSALYQVSQLAKTFGTTYSSGVLSFGEPAEQT